MIAGARQGRPSALRRLAAGAMSRDLRAIVVPGPEVLSALGLDLRRAGVRTVPTPREANVLLLAAAMPAALAERAAVLYAQMVRPRVVFAVAAQAPDCFPEPDVVADPSPEGLAAGVRRLRTALAQGAFAERVRDFDAPVLHGRVEYVCPMHPEVVQDEPGACPKCGMTLVPRDAAGAEQDSHSGGQSPGGGHAEGGCGAAHHAEHEEGGSGGDSAGGAGHGHSHEASNESGHQGHSGHGGGMGFMSMVEVTRDLPRSPDGLPMDWSEVPFGPFFPGLPGGLKVVLTLDGDGVVRGSATSLVGNSMDLPAGGVGAREFVARLAGAMPLAPVAYRWLARRALERAAGRVETPQAARRRAADLERERGASHLGWLAQLGRQLDFGWLVRRATDLQILALSGRVEAWSGLRSEVKRLVRRLTDTPLLSAGLEGIGRLERDHARRGPVARAAGLVEDARLQDPAYGDLGFEPVVLERGDALERFRVRLREIEHSLTLIERAGAPREPVPERLGSLSGKGEAVVETPRGRASLELTLEAGQVVSARVDTPCSGHIALVPRLVERRELGDALVAVGSLDLSPWEVMS